MSGVLAAEIWRRSEGAKTALSLLPLRDAHLEQYESWLSQASGYAYSLLRGGLYGTTAEGTAERLAALAQVCTTLNAGMTALKERADAGDAVFEALARGQGTAATVSSVFSQAEEEFPEYEGLTYDGPYSEHITQLTARGLAGQPEHSEEQARAAAAALLGADAGTLSLEYTGGGAVPFYSFSDGAGLSVRITKQGGRLLGLTDEREPGVSALTQQEAAEKAAVWLETHGFSGMTAGYCSLSGGIAAVNCYAVAGDAILYPDLVQVGVALDDGAVVRVDASGYWMNHTARQAPAVDRSAVPPQGPEILSERLAVIPTAGKNERWCREYLCQSAAGKALCYVGCESGQVEELLLVVEGDNGTLVR